MLKKYSIVSHCQAFDWSSLVIHNCFQFISFPFIFVEFLLLSSSTQQQQQQQQKARSKLLKRPAADEKQIKRKILFVRETNFCCRQQELDSSSGECRLLSSPPVHLLNSSFNCLHLWRRRRRLWAHKRRTRDKTSREGILDNATKICVRKSWLWWVRKRAIFCDLSRAYHL